MKVSINEEDPLVCIMIPVFNGEKTLHNAIASLLSQSYTNWFCIIVNDGSTDNTAKILNDLKDDRLKVIHFEINKGRPIARQVALENAAGDYLAFLDADDFYHPHKIEMQVRTFLKHPEIDVVSCFMGSYDEFFVLQTVRGIAESKSSEVLNYEFTGAFEAPHAASMTRLLPSKETGYNAKLKFAQDADFFVRHLIGKKYFVLKDVLYYYSEYESVTLSKVLKTYYYGIVRLGPLISTYPYRSIKVILLIILKAAFSFLISPFVNKDYYVRKRGREPLMKEISEFNLIIENFHVY